MIYSRMEDFPFQKFVNMPKETNCHKVIFEICGADKQRVHQLIGRYIDRTWLSLSSFGALLSKKVMEQLIL